MGSPFGQLCLEPSHDPANVPDYPASNLETVASESEQILHYRVLARNIMDMSPSLRVHAQIGPTLEGAISAELECVIDREETAESALI